MLWSEGERIPNVSWTRTRDGDLTVVDDQTEAAEGPEDERRLKAFGLRMKLLRVSRGWSQEQLAEAAGMHRTVIGQVERGQRGMNILGLWHLSRAFGVPIGDLFTDVEGRPIP
jgi:DNA-binding XRE family transcriptional regulator